MSIKIDIIDAPKQVIKFNAAGIGYTVELIYNHTDVHWFINFTVDNRRLVTGRRLLVGIDLISEYFAGMLYAKDSSNNVTPASYASLVAGNTRLYFITRKEVQEFVTNNKKT